MIVIDTSGLLCYHNQADPQHAKAKQVIDAAGRKVIHGYVLAEFTALAEARHLPRVSALAFAAALLDTADIAVTWVNDSLHRSALSLLNARLDKSYSLCDAVSFVLMRDLGITNALSTDRHFPQEGFNKLLD